MRKVIASSSEDEGDDKGDGKNGETLVVAVHSGGHGTITDSGPGGLGLVSIIMLIFNDWIWSSHMTTNNDILKQYCILHL